MLNQYTTSKIKKQAKRTRRNKPKHVFVSHLNDFRYRCDKLNLGSAFPLANLMVANFLRYGAWQVSIKELSELLGRSYRITNEALNKLVSLGIIKKTIGHQSYKSNYNGITTYFLGHALFKSAKLEILCKRIPVLFYLLPIVLEVEKETWKNNKSLATGRWTRSGVLKRLRGVDALKDLSLSPKSYSYPDLNGLRLCKPQNVRDARKLLPSYQVKRKEQLEQQRTHRKVKISAIEKVATIARPSKAREPVTLHPKALRFLQSIGCKLEYGALEHV